MRSSIVEIRYLPKALAVMLCITALIAAGFAQTRGIKSTRKLWDQVTIDHLKNRVIFKRPRKRTYRIATPDIPPARVVQESVIGLTVWRLNQPLSSRERDLRIGGARLLERGVSGEIEWRPRRVEASSLLPEDEPVRLSIEAARAGYLYVINQERYADGRLGEPYLIFPTTSTRGGSNEVEPGQVIEIPAQGDDPPYFKLERSGPDHVGEVLTLLMTTKPLELKIGPERLKLSSEQVAMWEKSWSSQVGRLEMEGGVGRLWTKREKQAGSDPERLLTDEDPMPQTIYYWPDAKSDQPMLVRVQLRFGSSGPLAR